MTEQLAAGQQPQRHSPHVVPRPGKRPRELAIAVLLALLVAAGAFVAHARSTASTQEGCTLRITDSTVQLTVAEAMTLTDIAGADQNAARSLAQTAASVAKTWPAEAANAAAIASSLRGYAGGALACTGSVTANNVQTMGPDGLTPRAETMWKAVGQVFGALPVGGFAPGGVTTGHVPGSAHYEGRAIDFLYRPVTAKSTRHGWVLAQWFVAHATPLQIATVIFDDKIWTPGGWDAKGWTTYNYPDGPTTNPTLLHLDHVHADVQRG